LQSASRQTRPADAIYHHLKFAGTETGWQFNRWNGYMIEANGVAALATYKMNMVVVMMSRSTIVFAQGISD
jgi:hypothetical protein